MGRRLCLTAGQRARLQRLDGRGGAVQRPEADGPPRAGLPVAVLPAAAAAALRRPPLLALAPLPLAALLVVVVERARGELPAAQVELAREGREGGASSAAAGGARHDCTEQNHSSLHPPLVLPRGVFDATRAIAGAVTLGQARGSARPEAREAPVPECLERVDLRRLQGQADADTRRRYARQRLKCSDRVLRAVRRCGRALGGSLDRREPAENTRKIAPRAPSRLYQTPSPPLLP